MRWLIEVGEFLQQNVSTQQQEAFEDWVKVPSVRDARLGGDTYEYVLDFGRFLQLKKFKNLGEIVAMTELTLSYCSLVCRLASDILQRYDGKYIFITEKGRLGFSSIAVECGQQICYFPGGKQLHILSSSCDRHICNAMVQGLMGDALQELKEEDFEIFHLK